VIGPTDGRAGIGRSGGRLRKPPPGSSGVFSLGAGLGGLIALLLCHLLVLRRTIRSGGLTLLRCALAAQRRVTHDVPGRLLATAEQLVEKSHVGSLRLGRRQASASFYPLGPQRNRRRSIKNAKAGEPEGSSALARRAYETRARLVKRPPTAKFAHVADFGRSLNPGGNPTGTLARAVAKKVRTPPPPK